MTPVDDLRSAAVLLRRLAAYSDQLMPGPWRVVLTDTESPTGVASCPDHEIASGDACDRCTHIECWLETVADYVARVGPDVGLALADALDLEAEHVVACRLGEQHAGAEPGILTGKREDAMVALARLILGEPLPVPDGFRSVETVHLPVLGDSS